MKTGPFAVQRKSRFSDLEGKLICAMLPDESPHRYGKVEAVEESSILLRPYLNLNRLMGNYEEIDESLTISKASLNFEIVNEEFYASLQEKDPWREAVGFNVVVTTKTGNYYPGLLKGVNNGYMSLDRFSVDLGDNLLTGQIGLRLDDVESVTKIPLEGGYFRAAAGMQKRLSGFGPE